MPERPYTPRVLEVAESITIMVEGGMWTRDRFPSKEEIARRLAAGHGTVKQAFDLLAERGVLTAQADPATEYRVQRLLPPEPGIEVIGRSFERIADTIAAHVADGTWAVELPTLEEMCGKFGCGAGTICRAMRLAQQRGVVHREWVRHPNHRHGTYRWMPAGVSPEPEPALVDQMIADIRSRALTSPVLNQGALCRRYRVEQNAMREAVTQLTAQNFMRWAWLPDWSRPVYMVGDPVPASVLPATGSKANAIAADLARRLPEWIYTRPDGQVAGRRLPAPENLRKHYRTSRPVVVKALNGLVIRGLLDRRDAPGWTEAEYRPIPRPGRPGVAQPRR